MALFYADASALVKLVRDEPESDALRAFLADADIVSCELVLTEVPRAIRRAAAHDAHLPLDVLIDRAGELLDAVALLPLDRRPAPGRGALAEPALRTLDAIHVAAAVDLSPLDAFRQLRRAPERCRTTGRPPHAVAGRLGRRAQLGEHDEAGPTTRGSSWVPAASRSRRTASGWLSRLRYGRSVVIAWYESQAKMIRDSSGISSPARPSG